jgi:uncharacterized protein YndB with AHSA1/START domain
MIDRDDDGTSEALSFEVELDAPPAQVWRALTVPDYLARWLTGPPDEPANDAEGARPPLSIRLIESEPGRSVRYAWREEADPLDSVVTFRIRPNDAGGATLIVVHEVITARLLLRPRVANRNAPPLLLAA